jgi:hypothetical protein
MSEAKSGNKRKGGAGCRFAHPGYQALNQPAALASLRRSVRMNSV